MTRQYAVRGTKRKKIEENYNRGESEQLAEVAATETSRSMMPGVDEDEKIAESVVKDLPGFPISPIDQRNKTGVTFVLEKASLEVGKVGKNYQILSSEDHANFLRKNNKNPADYRPDIVYHALLMILDSPINKAGRLQAVYVRTEKGVLFEVKPCVRIPRTYKRFAGIMLQLLQKLSITAVGKREKLMRVIKNPVTQYLPPNSHRIGFSYSSDKLVNIQDYVAAIEDGVNFVFVVGAMAHGKIDKEFTDDYISISSYPLSAAWCIGKICEAMAKKWKVLSPASSPLKINATCPLSIDTSRTACTLLLLPDYREGFNNGGAFNNGATHLQESIHSSFDLSIQTGRVDAKQNTLLAWSTGIRMRQMMNGGTINSESGCSSSLMGRGLRQLS
ncbi:hypothetical protein Nepgr_022035 [Nepenthes gracilis]|uniref:Ribosomal RNA small subunit methyltransferase NEP1 n=1 Tax=Nepenthes gracilis TaxID=150966 RepID=A0AAD3T050_NEPGR|nr:hypothetical protein Nepgr_022035 [Nepenthes gracilis]